MFKRKILVASVMTLLSSIMFKDISALFFVFPFFFLYGIPVSLFAEFLLRNLNNHIKRALYSMVIHIGAVAIFYPWDGGSGWVTLFCINAFSFYILDEFIILIKKRRKSYLINEGKS
ncbi:hypothetical protein [Neobacillus sp. SuZ13]|uniref:hypothetical protein n=1 Tax=Neobacillus sp. SuZ13 TaxID=3047875 RepID=UPI0024C07B89|nr:hypothetical protein [Neobacillus sp. SuZ13]WHY69823.1 hypothetical protein QNH17_14870 [Neobacillus sp. SuZ13]